MNAHVIGRKLGRVFGAHISYERDDSVYRFAGADSFQHKLRNLCRKELRLQPYGNKERASRNPARNVTIHDQFSHTIVCVHGRALSHNNKKVYQPLDRHRHDSRPICRAYSAFTVGLNPTTKVRILGFSRPPNHFLRIVVRRTGDILIFILGTGSSPAANWSAIGLGVRGTCRTNGTIVATV